MSWDAGAGLEEKRVIITGAAGAIGSAIVRALSTAGARNCLVDREGSAISELKATLDDPGKHLAIGCDLLDHQQREEMFARVFTAFGGLDVLVHAAGVLARTPVDEMTEDVWDWHVDNNLKVTFFVDRAAAQLMILGGRGGRIVNFASDAWWTGGMHPSTAYAASKGGVVSLSRNLARNYAANGITVNCVAPGTVESRMMREGLTPEQNAHIVDAIPLGRLAQPDDVAAAAVFLASDHASFITATVLNVSGGELLY
jgi:NAD(P)-dependent dehydrogenase (short-subunit alcohol dehydrogenase family)